MKLLSLFLLFAIPTSIQSQVLTQEWSIKPAWAELYGVDTYVGSKPYGDTHLLTVSKGLYEYYYLDYIRLSFTNLDKGTNNNINFNAVRNEVHGFTPLSFDINNSGEIYISTKKLTRIDTDLTSKLSILKFSKEESDTLWSKDLSIEYDHYNRNKIISFDDYVVASHGKDIFVLDSNGNFLKSDSLESEVLYLNSFSDSTFSTISRTSENNLHYTLWSANSRQVIDNLEISTSLSIRSIRSNNDYVVLLLDENTVILLDVLLNEYYLQSYDDDNIVFNRLAIDGNSLHISGTSTLDTGEKTIHAPVYRHIKLTNNALQTFRNVSFDFDDSSDLYLQNVVTDTHGNVLLSSVDKLDYQFPDYHYAIITKENKAFELELDGGSNSDSYYYLNFYNSFSFDNGTFVTVSKEHESVGHADYSRISVNKINNNLTNSISEESVNTINRVHLKQNYPNPFNPSTNISIELQQAQSIELSIYTIHGKLIKTIAQGFHNSGEHQFTIDLSEYASGVYMYQLKGNDFLETKKMTLIK